MSLFFMGLSRMLCRSRSFTCHTQSANCVYGGHLDVPSLKKQPGRCIPWSIFDRHTAVQHPLVGTVPEHRLHLPVRVGRLVRGWQVRQGRPLLSCL